MSASLYQRLADRVGKWRDNRYKMEQYPTIGEILDWAKAPEGSGFQLRPPQVRALETYWYLRLIEGTPHIFALYQKLFPKTADLLAALGVSKEAFEKMDFDLDALWQAIKTDDDFAHEYRLESLRETLTLDYASYILALAMGAGKTALIGAIIATEFAMALEYPDGPFVQNSLVFAPGTTIIESLRELAQIPYDRILPPRLYKPFAASVKLTFTREGEKDIPVIRGSVFNVVVTNTEKIRIQKETIRKSDIGSLFAPKQEDAARSEIANLRLQAIASLPHLAVFSDEAHHTYGQALDTELKKVRKELAVDAWLEEWNRLRKKGDVPNKIEVIELRTDPKYGKFIAHQPAQAKVSIRRVKDNLIIEVEDFISPTIIERLSQQEGVLKPKITDWRAMVDCVMIDPAYDGKVFNICLSDVPEKKSDFVTGKYDLPAPSGRTTVAVKLTDMLGEEVLVTRTV